jgi:hypothetical protein
MKYHYEKIDYGKERNVHNERKQDRLLLNSSGK